MECHRECARHLGATAVGLVSLNGLVRLRFCTQREGELHRDDRTPVFTPEYGMTPLHLLMAASMAAVVPMAIVCFVTQRYFVRGTMLSVLY